MRNYPRLMHCHGALDRTTTFQCIRRQRFFALRHLGGTFITMKTGSFHIPAIQALGGLKPQILWNCHEFLTKSWGRLNERSHGPWKRKKTCQNQKIGQGTLHIPLSKPCLCRWRVSIQRSYRAPDQPCKPSRRLYLGCHLENTNTSQMFHRNCRCLPCLKSHEIWEVLRCDHLKSSILGYKRSLEKPRITFSKVSSSYSTKIFARVYQTWILQKIYLRTEHSYPWPTWNPSTSGSPVPNSCKTARIPKPSHPHPGFSQRTLHVQVAQTFTLSIDAEEVLHQILLRHLKLSADGESEWILLVELLW